jgi:hypothetical protein
MEIVEGGGRELWLGEVDASTSMASPPGGSAFALMIVAFRQAPDVEMHRVARALIDQGCRYAVYAGVDSDAWETAFDLAALETNPECEPDRFVTTTSHPTEPLDDVAAFLFSCTAIDGDEPKRFVVAGIGAEGDDRLALRLPSLARCWRCPTSRCSGRDPHLRSGSRR